MCENIDLSAVEIFKYLDAGECNRILRDTSEKAFAAGQVIFEAGSIGNEMFIIKDGRVKIHRMFEGSEIIFAEFDAGAAFGEMSLIDEYPRSASAAAIGDCVLLSFSRQAFHKIIADESAIAAKLLLAIAEVFSKRMRQTDKMLETYYLVNKALISNEEFRQLYKAIHA
jgi:CRP/FNR family cyclic AMP-dependent transcriptional regulator